ncbi:folate-binding protein YgfZ [Phormidium sp. CLA17]|uniref:CAF17-like 4Fe-4S cluster assembly/insertion protein YgfZ n=1 Tax=Leptolyngbya sp. Cla-17 TaxID=2803751 RepID=UPI001492ABCC|nr:folate-binding protein YgfZ [Leptolyngbya sp. Cla-17]MBM0740586.1 folate-binding protein YgfZ [Leptolyngbya sp. Cla-17]
MIQSLREVQQRQGAQFEESSIAPISFGNDVDAIAAAHSSVVLCDRTHWGRLQLSGADRQTFLHNQSTNDIKILQPGQGCDTVFVTPTARTIDLATAYMLEDAVLVVVSPNRRDHLMKWLDRYIFFGDKVQLKDITDEMAMFSLIGAQSSTLLEKLGVDARTTQPYGSHCVAEISSHPVRIAMGSGLGSAGYTIIVAADYAAAVWDAIAQAGAVLMGDRAWNQLRIQQGRPVPDAELTEDYNAVEACLWQAISINKGCYIGQETIARLDTYKGVKQQIWGIRLDVAAEPGTVITINEEKVGILTSLTETAQGVFGLGYIRTKAGDAGLKVQIGTSQGELLEVPFLKRTRE